MLRCTIKTRMVSLLMVLILLMMPIPMADAEESVKTLPKYGYNQYPLNVRKEPSLGSEWMMQYPSGSTIEILGEEYEGLFYKVEKGYVQAEYVLESVDVYEYARVKKLAVAFDAPAADAKIVDSYLEGTEVVITKKQNGYVKLQLGGWIKEVYLDFHYMDQIDLSQSRYSLMDMLVSRMPDLKIGYLATLNKPTSGKCVTLKGQKTFSGQIPIYDVIEGYAYFPSGRGIYKIKIDNFSDFRNVDEKSEVLDTYRTVYFDSTIERKKNIERASRKFKSVVIEKEGTFSFNDIVGELSKGNGYKKAPILDKNKKSVYGGGVSQVSSSIYAALRNDKNIEIVERNTHDGMDVKFLPENMDAYIAYGAMDLVFINHYPFKVELNISSHDGVCFVTLKRAR